MNTSSGNPFNYSSAMAKNNGLMPNSSSRMALDNLLRRELKVSDPNDAKQIAEALLNRYKNNPRALAINKEAEGVPFLLASGTPMPLQQAPTSSDAEMQQAINDVERDLRELTTNSILKDVTPELEGWAMAVRSAIQEGVNSARFALDPRQRDKTFGIRRTLGDYARLARLVGALTPTMSLIYRKFAQSLDEVASVLFVMMGEALSNVGFGGRYLLQAPYSELQVRRDAVIYALRNLVGATQEAYAPNEWPRGIDAYRQLFQRLEEQGQGDLRALLVEGELSRVMDALIQRSGQGSVAGLRQLGATAQLDVERLRRLVIVGKNLIYPAAPPLTAFLEALQLFVDGFEPSGGFRLLRIARPPILFYGLYGMSAFDEAEERLLRLIIERNQLADKLDCYLQCGCTSKTVLCQIVLDKILYDLDRAIDLYAVGTQDTNDPLKKSPEKRAVAYSYIVDVFLFPNQPNAGGTLQRGRCLLENETEDDGGLLPGEQGNSQQYLNHLIYQSCLQIRKDLYVSSGNLERNDNQVLAALPDNDKTIRDLVCQELQVQKDMEGRWENLVQTMAPSCIPFRNVRWNNSNNNHSVSGVFNVMNSLINRALQRALGKPEDDSQIDLEVKFELPGNYEESLRDIADKMPPQLEDISEAVDTIAYNLGEPRRPAAP